MNKLVSLTAALVLAGCLTACGDDGSGAGSPADLASGSPSVVRTSGTAGAAGATLRVLGTQPTTACGNGDIDLIWIYEMRVSAPITVTALDPTQVSGVRLGRVLYAPYPERVDGHRNGFSGGSSVKGTTMPQHFPGMRVSAVATTNWSHRAALQGAKLRAGHYLLFLPLHAPASGGKVTAWTIGWRDADGDKGTNSWNPDLTFARHCH